MLRGFTPDLNLHAPWVSAGDNVSTSYKCSHSFINSIIKREGRRHVKEPFVPWEIPICTARCTPIRLVLFNHSPTVLPRYITLPLYAHYPAAKVTVYSRCTATIFLLYCLCTATVLLPLYSRVCTVPVLPPWPGLVPHQTLPNHHPQPRPSSH
jgi:hypothetical protein